MGKDQELLDAARNGDIGVVGKILEHITKRSIGPLSSFRRSPNINAQDMNGYTPLHHACLNGHSNIVRLLLAHGATPDVPDIRGSTPLYLAAWAGHGDIMKMLLFHPEKPVNPNAQTIENDTPLHCAAQHGHTAALSILLAYGADPTIRNNSFQTALDLAAQFGRLQAVQMLIRTHVELIQPYALGSDQGVRYSPSYESTTPTKHIFTHTCLHLASRNGHKKVVEALLAAGVDVNILTHAGSALHEAALCGKKSVVVVLLQAGINIEAVDGLNRTALDVLKEYPPHVTYEIVSTINDFCQHNKCASLFRPIKDENENQQSFASCISELQDKSQSVHTPKCLTPTANVWNENKPMNIKSNKSSDSSKSLEAVVTPRPGYYLQMKPIIGQNSEMVKFRLKENVHTCKPVYTQSGPLKGKISYTTGHKSADRTPLDTNHSKPGTSPTSPQPCADGYVRMIKPQGVASLQMQPPRPKAPFPSPRHFDQGDYENINLVHPANLSPKLAKITPLRAFAMDFNNNYKHSPTPECPPPTVTQAEDAIFEFIQPLSAKSKRKSLRLYNVGELNLEHFIFDGFSAEDSTDTRSSRASDYVEEFVGDVPFAGLFKGSTFTLNAIDNDGMEAGHPLRQPSSGLRSPSLVKAVKPVPAKRKLSLCQKTASSDDLNVSKVWAEIDTILETIGNEVSSAELFAAHDDAPTAAAEVPETPANYVEIRNPSDLVLGVSGKPTGTTAAKWCHSSNALIDGEIMYTAYYLGSTVIRELRGTLSTRKSIQKLKRDETPIFEEESEASLLEDCNSFTKILKANNQQTRLEVGIAFSCAGVKFIDTTNKSTICIHDIQNINCVCQDNEDLRYFAYITKEQNIHYCHVFMVDSLELAKEIILTLGQAFEVAYQLALQQHMAPITEDINNSNHADIANNV